ncbi:MAG TPA: trypsin-like peptidase domain-containing protein [Longimicrobiales bacterium]
MHGAARPSRRIGLRLLAALLVPAIGWACDPTARAAEPAAAEAGIGSAAAPEAPAALASAAQKFTPAAPAQESAEAQDLHASRRTAIVTASQRVAPAVVSVNVIRGQTVWPRDWFDALFFGPVERRVASLGSGFVIREDGLILTNEHVVRGAEEVVVTLADGRDFEAEVLGVDEATDLALLRIRPDGPLPVAPLGDSDDLMIGEWVIAIGNPFGFMLSNSEPTVTAGVVSALGRNIIPDGRDQRGYYLDMIQTDASINPGNSGGPLVNALGEVVGVNSSILSTSGGSEGLGFAIPINRARRIADDILAYGHVRRAWIGLEVEPAEANRFGRSREVRVASVAPGSPAAEAGLRPGMVVESAGGKALRTPLDWQAALLDMRVGQPFDLVVSDGARRRTVRLRPQDLPSLAAERVRAFADFELVTVTPAIRAQRGLVSERGALVASSSAMARNLGLREGDVIISINRYAVDDAEEAAELLRRAVRRGYLSLLIERNGQYLQQSFMITS